MIVAPSENLPEWTLITSGMSDVPMKTPNAEAAKHYLELLIRLPADWPMEQSSWKDEKNYWPVRLLKFIAHFPHQYGAFLWVGHTMDNGQPAAPWSASAPFKAAFLAPSRTLPKAFEVLKISEEKTIKFIALYPCYLEESALARQHGANALWKKFVDHQITDILDPIRANVAGTAGPAQKPSFWNRLTGR